MYFAHPAHNLKKSLWIEDIFHIQQSEVRLNCIKS